jgi:hypothetical protein
MKKALCFLFTFCIIGNFSVLFPQATAKKSKLSIHTSFIGSKSMNFVQSAKPRLIKILDRFEYAQQVKTYSPYTIIIGRSYSPESEEPLYGDPIQRAQEWFNKKRSFIEGNPLIDYWEGYNEPWKTDLPGLQWYGLFEAERVRLLASIGRKACIGNFMGGSPVAPEIDPSAWEAFLPAIDAAIMYDGILGKHEYGCPLNDCYNEETGEGAECGSYRKAYRKYLIPLGKILPVAITEAGLSGPNTLCGRGWNGKLCSSQCCGWKVTGYTWEEYRDQLIWYDNIMKEDDYVLGATIFSLEIYGWDDFDIGNPPEFMDWLTQYVSQGSYDITAPPKPQQITPSDNATIGSSSFPIRFKWSAVEDDESPPVRYDLDVAKDSNFSSLVVSQRNLVCTWYNVHSLPTGTYYWRVRAKDSCAPFNKSPWAGPYKFTIADGNDTTPPSVPLLLYPYNGETIREASIVLYWARATDENDSQSTVTYDLQVANNTNFSSPIVNETNLSSLNYDISSKISGTGEYWWRVRARDAKGNASAWSCPWKIIIGGSTDVTVFSFTNSGFELEGAGWIMHPIENCSNIYAIDSSVKYAGEKSARISIPTSNCSGAHIWQATTGDAVTPGKKYRFWCWIKTENVSGGRGAYLRLLWGDNNFGWIAREDQYGKLQGTNDWTKVDTGEVIVPDGAQRLQVALFLDGTGTAWFDNVNVGEDTVAPFIPRMISPLYEEEIFTFPVTFKWTISSDVRGESHPVKYDFQIDNDANFSPPLVANQSGIGTPTYTVSSLPKGEYWWRVRARDSAVPQPNSSCWTQPRKFYVISGSTVPPSGNDLIPPAAVNTLSAQPGPYAGTIVLSWRSVGDDGEQGNLTGYYKIQYLKTNGPWDINNAQIIKSVSNIVPGTELTYLLQGLDGGVTHYVVVWACDESDNCSEQSNVASTYATPGSSIIVPKVNKIQIKPTLVTQDRKAKLEYKVSKAGEIQFEIYSLSGDLVKRFTKVAREANITYEEDLPLVDDKDNKLPSGVYFIYYTTPSGDKDVEKIIYVR